MPNKSNIILFIVENENQSLIFRCFSGDRVEVKLLIPVCNFERENAIIMATETVKARHFKSQIE